MGLLGETHSFDVELARIYGVECAILIKSFIHWINLNERNNKAFNEGKTWTYQTLKSLAAHFPYWTENHIVELIEKLCRGRSRRSKKNSLDFEPVLIKNNFNPNPYDKTTWYTFTDSFREILATAKIEKDSCQDRKRQLPTSYKDKVTEKDTEKDNTSELASGLATYFFTSIKRINPKILDPSMSAWTKEFVKMLEIDKRSAEDLRQVIDYILHDHDNPCSESFTWSKAVLSPAKLRKHFAQIWMQITHKTPAQAKEMAQKDNLEQMRKNKEWIEEIASQYRPQFYGEDTGEIIIGTHSVRLRNPRRGLYYEIGYGERYFREMIEKALNNVGIW